MSTFLKHYEEIFRSEGRAEGLVEGKRLSYFEMVHDGDMTVEKGALKTKLSVEEFIKEMKQAGFEVPKE